LSAAYPWYIQCTAAGQPSVGWLMDLCDENYRTLIRLVPDLRGLRGCFLSRRSGCQDLYLEVLEQTPYTSLVHLTHLFSGPVESDQDSQSDPDVVIRVYHDSAQAEVVRLRQTALPLDRPPYQPTLQQKWKVNLFLSRWLAYTLGEGHRFGLAQRLNGAKAQAKEAAIP